MIKKNALTTVNQEITNKNISKNKLPLSSSNTSNSGINQEDDIAVFDARRILEGFHDLRESQHQTLVNANLSEEFKRLLFGFP